MAMPVELSSEPSSVLKVLLRDEGIYGVGLQTIADGMGRVFEEIQVLAQSKQLRITCQGELVATRFDAVRNRLLFVGHATENWYTRDAAYLIAEGPGLAMLQRAPGADSGDTVFPVDLRLEEDRYPFDSALSRPDDFYYWDYVISGHATLGQKDVSIDLAGFAGEQLELSVRLRGWSNTDQTPDHAAEFYFNGDLVGHVLFDGQQVTNAVLSIPAALVLDGVNTLGIRGVLAEGHTHSFFVLDHIDALFSRALTPLDQSAFISPDDAQACSAASFDEPIVIALGTNGVPVWIADETGGLSAKAWTQMVGDARFAVVDAEAVPMLGTSPAAPDAWFLSASNRIDYLVITSRELESAVQELADYRTEQGLRVGVVVFEDICDLLVGGLRTPEAIPALLRYAADEWRASPWMVLLAGSGNYDYLDALGREVNHVPPMLHDTHDGLFAADALLTDLDGDLLPDIAVGRLPALTSSEVTTMIAKIKAYEAGFGSALQNQLVFVADTADEAGDFGRANQSLAMRADATHPAELIDMNLLELGEARAQLIDRFNTGAGFIHYTGHGGVNNFSKQSLLTASDVAGMDNSDAPPVVVALSCLVGRYEAPGVTGMGEALMRKAHGGAVAVWGPSGLSRNAPAVQLGDALYQTIIQGGSGTLGLAILEARRKLTGDLFTADTFAIYNLLGDPALRIAGNTSGQPTDENFATWRWQRFSPAELEDREVSGAKELFTEYVSGDEGRPQLSLRSNRLQWKQHRFRKDLDYRILTSTDLVDWIPGSFRVHMLSAESDVKGVMSEVSAALESSEKNLFMKLEVRRK